MTPEKKKRKRKRSQDEIVLRRVTILAVVAVVMLVLALALRFWIREPEITPPPAATPVPGVEQPGTDPVPEKVSERRKGVYTFLLLGRDTGGGGNTDTMMVATYDTVNQTVNVLNVYRDTMVNAPWDIKRINAIYGISGGGEKGIEALKGHLKDLLGFAPDFYVTIEWDAVGELVDAIGGVEFDVPYEMHYWDPTQNLRIDQAKGYRTLYGEDAMQVIRWRQNNDGSGVSVGDVGRVGIQQDFLRAVVAKCLKTINLTTIPKFAQIFMDNVTTDIPLGTIAWFGTQALGLDMGNLSFHSLPGKLNGAAWSRTYQNMQSYVLPDGAAIVELVNAGFNPYNEPIELSDLDIMSVNKDGSLSSSRGEVKDTPAAVAPVIPSRAPKPSAAPSPSPQVTQQPTAEPEQPVEIPTQEPEETPVPEEPVETQTPEELPAEPVSSQEPTPTPEAEISPEFLPAMPTPAA